MTVPIITWRDCYEYWGDSLTADMVCTRSLKGGRDSYTGDVGGPLTINGVQIGVISTNYCGTGFPTIYARVSVQTDWIRENL